MLGSVVSMDTIFPGAQGCGPAGDRLSEPRMPHPLSAAGLGADLMCRVGVGSPTQLCTQRGQRGLHGDSEPKYESGREGHRLT